MAYAPDEIQVRRRRDQLGDEGGDRCGACPTANNRRHFISAIFDLFDEIVKKAKKELGGVTTDSLQIVISPLCNLPEDRLPKTQKRESLVDVMRSMLNSDTSIEDEDISNS